MSMSKKNKELKKLELKKFKRNRIIIIVGSILVTAGIIAGAVFLIDWDKATAPPVHSQDDGCC